MGDFFQNGKHLRHVIFFLKKWEIFGDFSPQNWRFFSSKLEIFFKMGDFSKMGDFLHFRNKCRIRKNTITYKGAFQLSLLKKII